MIFPLIKVVILIVIMLLTWKIIAANCLRQLMRGAFDYFYRFCCGPAKHLCNPSSNLFQCLAKPTLIDLHLCMLGISYFSPYTWVGDHLEKFFKLVASGRAPPPKGRSSRKIRGLGGEFHTEWSNDSHTHSNHEGRYAGKNDADFDIVHCIYLQRSCPVP